MLDPLANSGDTFVMRYDGGKGTCFAQLINLMPPHRQYIETHLGGGAVMRHKRPADRQIGIDLDPDVVTNWRTNWSTMCEAVHGDAVDYLGNAQLDGDTVIYADPPYHPDTRRRSRVYRFDYSVRDHERLLDCLTGLPCKILLSGYPSSLYERKLAGWSVHRFNMRTHVDTREEWVWFNFPTPKVLHDDRYLGDNFREREVIRRRQMRIRDRIDQLSIVEQQALCAWLSNKLHREVTP
ncbi:MAG TPA: DNA adenine methylase [Burkholderiaceae bacterium]|nr:DNA adenine methylase [Burkholderiaceae bacterium]